MNNINPKDYINTCGWYERNHTCHKSIENIETLLSYENINIDKIYELFKKCYSSFNKKIQCIGLCSTRMTNLIKKNILLYKDDEAKIKEINDILYNSGNLFDSSLDIITYIMSNAELEKYTQIFINKILDYNTYIIKGNEKQTKKTWNKYNYQRNYNEFALNNSDIANILIKINGILFKSNQREKIKKYITMEQINAIYKFSLIIKDVSIPKGNDRYCYDFSVKKKLSDSQITKIDEITNNILTHKNFIPSYDSFIFSLCYDSYDHFMLIIKSTNINIKDTTLKDYLDILFDSGNITYVKTEDLSNILNLLYDNNSNPSLINQNNILNIYDFYNYSSPSFQNLKNNITCLCNFLADNKVKFTDNLFEFTLKCKIKIKNVKNIGIDLSDDKYASLCFNHNYNPYGLDKKMTLELLQGECNKSGNLTKVKTISKEIKPDIKCLENACLHKNNYHMAYYLCESFKLTPSINCLINAIKAVSPYGNSAYIIQEYNKNPKKEENKIENIIENNVFDNNNNIINNNNINNIMNNNLLEEKVIKKVIKKVVKKKSDDVTESVHATPISTTPSDEKPNEEKPKKIIRKVVKKKSDYVTDNITESEPVTPISTTPNDEKPKKKIIRKVVKKKSDYVTDNVTESEPVTSISTTPCDQKLGDQKPCDQKLGDQKPGEEKPKKIIRKVVKKKLSDNNITQNIENTGDITSTDSYDKFTKQIVNNKKIIDLNEYKIPDTYNYRLEYVISELGKKIYNIEKSNHIDIRKHILEHLKNNNKLDNTEYELENIKFTLNNIDKFINAYMIKI